MYQQKVSKSNNKSINVTLGHYDADNGVIMPIKSVVSSLFTIILSAIIVCIWSGPIIIRAGNFYFCPDDFEYNIF